MIPPDANSLTAVGLSASIPLLGMAWYFWILSVVGALLLAYLIVTAVVLAAYAKRVAALFLDSQIANRLPPASLPPDAKTEWFTTADGLKLRGLWLRDGRTNRLGRVVVFVHSTGEDGISAARYAGALIDHGYDVFSFDSRGCGRSEGVGKYKVMQWISDREVEDLRSALRHVRNRLKGQGSAPDVALLGISRGGSAALVVAAEDEHVAAVAVDGTASTDDILWNFVLKWASVIARYKFMSLKIIEVLFYPIAHRLGLAWAQKLSGRRFPHSRRAVARGRAFPLLHIHAERDRVVTHEVAKRQYFAAKTADKQFWVVPKARHNEGVMKVPEEYKQKLISFFEQHFPPADAIG